jgi:2-deoxy-D-gluconate 3-dehydrogenase
MFDLSGRVAVVTGGNGGIGLGIARGLAQAGAALAIWARDAAKNEAAVKELESLGARALRCAATWATRRGCARREQTVAALGASTRVANAASAGCPARHRLEDWRRVRAST